MCESTLQIWMHVYNDEEALSLGMVSAYRLAHARQGSAAPPVPFQFHTCCSLLACDVVTLHPFSLAAALTVLPSPSPAIHPQPLPFYPSFSATHRSDYTMTPITESCLCVGSCCLHKTTIHEFDLCSLENPGLEGQHSTLHLSLSS